MDKNKRTTERFRPDVGPGGRLEGLSLPQHADRREAAAVQKHQVILVAAHVRMEALNKIEV